MISVAEALQRVLDSVEKMPTETVTLAAAHGRVLAQDVIARLTQPPTDVSAMDGYAVQAKDVAKVPATLIKIGESAAGKAFNGAIGPGETTRIFTGAAVPKGANAIVIQEHTAAAGSQQKPRPVGRTPGQEQDHLADHGDHRAACHAQPR